MYTREPRTLRIKVKGPGDVTAADIQTDATVEVLNPGPAHRHAGQGRPLRHGDRGQDRPRLLPRRVEQERGTGDRRDSRSTRSSRRCAASSTTWRTRAWAAGPTTTSSILEIWTDGRVSPGRRADHVRRHPAPPPRRLRELRQGHRRVRGEREAGGRGARGAAPQADHERQRDRAERARGQLPEQRQHHHRRRAGPEDRGRDAQVPQLRQEVAERDQAEARRARALRWA